MSDTSSRITIGTFGVQAMKYWPVVVVIVALVAAGAEARLTIRHHEKLIDLLTQKLESREKDNAQDRVIVSLLEEVNVLDTRLKEAEKHITPTSIQKWGEVQWKLNEVWNRMNNHLRTHEE